MGYAAWVRGATTGLIDRVAQYRLSVAAAEALTSQLDSSDAPGQAVLNPARCAPHVHKND